MEIEITSKKENTLLERVEVEFTIAHPEEKTPTRDSVRAKLSDMLKAPKDAVVVDHLKSKFGQMVTVGYAKVYKDGDTAKKIEREHILIRNKLVKKE